MHSLNAEYKFYKNCPGDRRSYIVHRVLIIPWPRITKNILYPISNTKYRKYKNILSGLLAEAALAERQTSQKDRIVMF